MTITIWSITFAIVSLIYFSAKASTTFTELMELIVFPFLFGFLGAIVGYHLESFIN